MSSPPRTRPNGDMRAVLEAVGKITDRLDEIIDHARRTDARLDETVKRTAASDASLDSLKMDHERGQQRLDNRTQEILATQTASYREFEAGLRGIKERVNLLEDAVNSHKAEDIMAATEGSAKGAAKGAVESANKTTRTVGLISFISLAGVVISNSEKIWGFLLRLIHFSATGDDPGQS